MKLSIVTINPNNVAGLSRTRQSIFVLQSGFDDWEQVVVDGASTDGSFEALARWKNDPRLLHSAFAKRIRNRLAPNEERC